MRKRPLAVALALGALILGGLASVAAADVTATAGVQYSGVVTTIVNSQCPNATLINTPSVSWGDGDTSDAGATAGGAQGQWVVSGTHTYANPGTYTGSATLTFNCSGANYQQTGAFTATVAAATSSAQSTTTATAPTTTSPTATTTTTATAPTTATTTSPPAPTTASPPPPAATAQFSILDTAAGHVDLTADASAPAATTASSYDWTLASAAGQDVVCPASEPQVRLNVRAGVNALIKLTTVDASSGAASSITQSVSIPAPSAARAGARGLALTGVCSGAAPPRVPQLEGTNLAANQRPPVSVGGGPPASCDQDVVFGAVDARGCFSQIPDPQDLPHGITFGLAKLLCGAHDQLFCLNAGGLVASAGALVNAAVVPSPEQQIGAVRSVLKSFSFPSYYSYSAIRVDGVDIVPQNGAPILIVPSADALIASGVRFFLDGRSIEPATVPLALYAPSAGGQLLSLTLPHSLPLVGDLPFEGSLSITLNKAHSLLSNGDRCQYACAALSIGADLPSVFTDADGNGLSANAVITADAVNGVQLDSLEVKVPSAQFAGIGVSDVDVRYSHANESLHAQATVNLFQAAGNITGQIDFLHGAFSDASVNWDAGDGPGIDLGGPLNIYLTHLGGSISLDPTTISATGTITGGPQTLGCALFGITGSMTLQFDPFSFDANATGQLLCQNVASEYLHIDQGGSILIGANIDVSILFFEFKGGIAFAADTAQDHIQADANMSACINILGSHCLGAEVVVSDRGAGICADLGFTHAGGGIQWPDTVKMFFDSCDIGQFRSLGYVTHATPSVPSFSVPPGQAVSVIGVTGASAAPRVTLHGPDGQSIDTPSGGYVRTATRLIVADDTYTHETYFLLSRLSPGRWTITADAGSVPVLGIQQAASLPAPDVHAHLRRLAGGRLALSYTLHPLAGQQVSFVERDAQGRTHVIGAARGRAGHLSFSTTPMLAAGRVILAEVSQNGHPREDDRVARYTASVPAPLAGPRGLRLSRSGGALRLSWQRVPGASAYAVTVRLSDHTTRFIQVRGTQATLAAFPAGAGATVRVQAVRVGVLGRRLGVGARAKLALRLTRHTVRVAPI